jgi:gamma-glutamyltranspeptidase/glutathione hydrolase
MVVRGLRTALAVTGVWCAIAASAAAQEKQPTAQGGGGAAATVDPLATKAAIDTLKAGGNAVDAAVAAAGVLGVTEPFSSGIGGGGFMVVRTRSGKITTIDGRETAPAAMGPTSFFDENGKPLPFDNAYDTARWTGMSVGVPGTVATWQEALRRYGTLSLRQALRPGARVARDGFTVDQTFFNQTNAVKDWFDDVPSTAAIYLDPDGTPHDVGTTVRNPDMAHAYRYIGRHGARGFYKGPIADAIAAAVQHPPIAPTANHRWRAGLMTPRDMARYDAIRRKPTHIGYRGLDVWSMGPPSSGGSTVGEALNILEGYDLGSLTYEQALHRRLEAARFAFADRGRYLADPAYYRVPLRGLLSDGFAATRRALIGERAATSPVAPGDPFPFQSAARGRLRASSATTERSGSTTHISTSDRDGNIVSYTFTIESTGGAGLVVPGYGFLLNNELTDFNFDSLTHPNRVRPGKRPRSSISPTIVSRDGRPWLTVGTPGGSTIITTVLQLLSDRLDLGMTLPQAIAAPRTAQRNTATTQAEPAFLATPEVAALRARGHSFVSTPEIGAATGIEFLADGRVLAAAEPVRRGGGSAMVEQPAP